MKKILFFSLFASVILTSCETDTDDPNGNVNSFTDGVFILNEGNFMAGNASLSFFNNQNDSLSNGVFTAVNQIPLGDVAQSMVVRGDKGYIVVNNSGKVEVVNLEDLSSAGTLSGLTSPRYVAFASNSKAYVTDLFSGSITIFNPENLSTTGSIATNGWTEEMVIHSGHLYVAGTGSGNVYKVDIATDLITDSVAVGVEPTSMALDANGKLWVLTTGGWQIEEPRLVRVNPSDLGIELSLTFPLMDNYPGNLQTNASGNVLYFLDGSVFSMPVTATQLPTEPVVSGFFYKLGFEKAADRLWVSDPLDFNSNGKVYRFTATGTAIDTLNVGVIPGNFCFAGQ